jgi:hypothetical protein
VRISWHLFNLVFIGAGDDYSLNWEQRLHIAVDAAQGTHLNCVFPFRPCMYVRVDKLQLVINYRTGVFT